ncbi:MAG TPA: hypothetical protein VMH39_07545 [Gemmatimonadaceae bacterium]|nr:hypothetical protein [Gemmatimonadaceae bacterium]
MKDDVYFLTVDEVVAIHADQIENYGGDLGLRDRGLLESAVHAAQNVAAYVTDCDLCDLAAAEVPGRYRFGPVVGITVVAVAMAWQSTSLDENQTRIQEVASDPSGIRTRKRRIKETSTAARPCVRSRVILDSSHIPSSVSLNLVVPPHSPAAWQGRGKLFPGATLASLLPPISNRGLQFPHVDRPELER